MSGTYAQLWGIILAGGEGRRLRSFIRLHWGSDRPKQYCAITGTRSMLRHTIGRAERVISPNQLLTVVTRAHLPYAQPELRDRPAETVIVQPWNRETGPGILLPLLHVHHRDPEAVVTIFPADHFILEEEPFMAAVEDAATFVTGDARFLVLLGVKPDRPDAGYGWIEVGEAIGGQRRGRPLYRVRRFWEKPSVLLTQALYREGGLWNTLVQVSGAGTLLERFQTLLPEVYALCEPIRRVLGSSREAEAVEEAYARLPTVNFSRAILERSPQGLGVLRVQGVYWSDWGDAARIRRDLARWGLQPGFAPARVTVTRPQGE